MAGQDSESRFERPSITSVVVCRGCCCGTANKHPGTDHPRQLDELRDSARRAGIRLRIAKCLDQCEHSNVIVVRQRHGARITSTWLGDMLREAQTKAIADWIRHGEPGALPPELAKQSFEPRPTRPPLAERYAAGLESSLTCPLATRSAVGDL